MIKHQGYLLATLGTMAVAFAFVLAVPTTRADSGNWDEQPEDNSWFNIQNWSGGNVPNGLNDVARFGPSAITEILATTVQNFSLAEVDFDSDAPVYTITIDTPTIVTTIDGNGVMNGSSNSHTFHLQDGTRLNFVNNSTAGEEVNYVVDSSSQLGFEDNSTAGTAQYMVDNAALSFDGTSAAGEAIITNTATVSLPGVTSFSGSSSGGNATLIAMDGPILGGAIYFFDGEANGTSGGTCKVQLFGNGLLDISPVALANGGFDVVTIGSLSGDGQVFLGSANLTVGSDDLTTSFSGPIQDGGAAGRTGGSLTKIGKGILTLSGANTYTGGTIISDGTVVAKNRSGSATGAGAVQVDAGSLSGRGTISGPVTIGTGDGAGASLTPSDNSSATSVTTLQSTVTFKADGTYSCKVSSSKGRADKVIANGVTIEAGAKFTLTVVGNKKLALGTNFLALNNTSTTPINGTFDNLPEGSVLTFRKNSYEVSYFGGDGNDLVLTVVQ